MNARESLFLADEQSGLDSPEVANDPLGDKGLRYPVRLAGRDVIQRTAKFALGIALEAEAGVAAYMVEAEIFDSIHTHSAHARTARSTHP